MTHILGIIGSLGERSLTRTAVLYVLDQARDQGASTDVIDLQEIDLPMFNPDTDTQATYLNLLEKVNAAQGYVLGTPDYHGSFSGALKNILDHFWKEFAGKLFGTVCTSYEKGLTVTDHLRTVIRQCYGWSLPYGVCVSPVDSDDDSAVITNPAVSKRLHMLASDMVRYTPLLYGQFEKDKAHALSQAGFASHYR